MTEQEWLECTDPQKMLRSLRGKASDRKLRLFACGCARQLQAVLLDDTLRETLEVAERFADGQASAARLRAASAAADALHRQSAGQDWWTMKPAAAAAALVRPNAVWLAAECARRNGAQAAANALRWGVSAWTATAVAKHMKKLLPQIRAEMKAQMPPEPPDRGERISTQPIVSFQFAFDDPDAAAAADRAHADLLRCVFGNPFRPVAAGPSWLSWQDGTLPKLAQAIYEDRTFDRLPILADALEEAGCQDAAILAHCRGPGPHARGCLVVDTLLGRT